MPRQPRNPSSFIQQDEKNALRSRLKQSVVLRQKNLRTIVHLLSHSNPLPPEALTLMARFHYSADELTEAGVSYEVVRAIETRYPFLLEP